jgi:hypothetical protein
LGRVLDGGRRRREIFEWRNPSSRRKRNNTNEVLRHRRLLKQNLPKGRSMVQRRRLVRSDDIDLAMSARNK